MRLPAYGRDLLAARKAGRHPPFIRILYGPGIPRPAAGPVAVLAVHADEYTPGRYDFRVCAGILCSIVDWCPAGCGSVDSLIALLCEVDRHAVGVDLRTVRTYPASARSRWAAETDQPLPLDGCMVSDLEYFLGAPRAAAGR